MIARDQARDTRLGIWLMCLVSFIFAMQDGISKHLSGSYNVWMVITIRYWFFAAMSLAIVARRPGGIAVALRSRMPLLQGLRGLLLVIEVCIVILAFVKLGLIATHAIFVSYPLMVAALSGPILGEKVGWRRWAAIGVGFVGVIIILNPGTAVFSLWSVVPLVGALMFALYALLTRYVARADAAMTSFLWTGIIGAVAITPVGLWMWQPMSAADWGWMLALCILATTAHFLLIKAFELAEASDVQPFGLLQIVWVSILAVVMFGEVLEARVVAGASLVVGAALFTLWRAKVAAKQAAAAAMALSAAKGPA